MQHDNFKIEKMIQQKFYPTIVISDVHLGTAHSKVSELTDFLSTVNCNTLILNGDIIDGWHLQKSTKSNWTKEHTNLFKVIMKMVEKHNTKIVYIRGNHDDFIDNIAPFSFANLSITKEYMHQSLNKRYYIVHGDVFDNITSNMRWLAKIGDMGYSFLLWLNKIYNRRRAAQGLPYFSLSQSIKHKVKSAVSYISNYENELVALAKSRYADGIICGHIHQPANKMIDNIHYLNSGDWVETMSALLENENGEWELYLHAQNNEPMLFDTAELKSSIQKNNKPQFNFAFMQWFQRKETVNAL